MGLVCVARAVAFCCDWLVQGHLLFRWRISDFTACFHHFENRQCVLLQESQICSAIPQVKLTSRCITNSNLTPEPRTLICFTLVITLAAPPRHIFVTTISTAVHQMLYIKCCKELAKWVILTGLCEYYALMGNCFQSDHSDEFSIHHNHFWE